MKTKDKETKQKTFTLDPKTGKRTPASPDEAFNQGTTQTDNDENLAREEENQNYGEIPLVEDEE